MPPCGKPRFPGRCPLWGELPAPWSLGPEPSPAWGPLCPGLALRFAPERACQDRSPGVHRVGRGLGQHTPPARRGAPLPGATITEGGSQEGRTLYRVYFRALEALAGVPPGSLGTLKATATPPPPGVPPQSPRRGWRGRRGGARLVPSDLAGLTAPQTPPQTPPERIKERARQAWGRLLSSPRRALRVPQLSSFTETLTPVSGQSPALR